MPLLNSLRMILWIAPITVQLIIALLMLRRRITSVFPIFTLYTSVVPLRDIILLFFQHRLRIYSWIYWMGELVIVLLAVAVIYETLWKLIAPYKAIRRIGICGFWLTVMCAGLFSALLLTAGAFRHTPSVFQWIVLLERSARFLQVGLLIVFAFFISEFGFRWQYLVVGIVAGFAVSAGLQLVVSEMWSHLHLISDNLFTILKPAAYNCAVLVWAIYFLPLPKPESIPKEMPDNDLAKWDEILTRYLRK